VKSALSQLESIETAAKGLGLTFEMQFSVKSLYPADIYSGMIMQLLRLTPRKGSRGMDIVGAGGRYNSLVSAYQQYLNIGHISKNDTTGDENVDGSEGSGDICATGFSVSVDRLVSAISKRDAFSPTIAQAVVAGEPAERGQICTELWRTGVRSVLAHSNRMDELTELAKEIGAEIIIFAMPEVARISFSDKDGRFLAEKKIPLGDVVSLVTRDYIRAGGNIETTSASDATRIGSDITAGNSSKTAMATDRLTSGPSVVYNFNFIDRDRYSQSKKRLEIRKSEKLAGALSRFDSSCEVLVIALGLPGTVVKGMAAALDIDDEERFEISLAELIKQYPRYRKYFGDVCEEIVQARFRAKLSSSIVLFSLEDNSFKIMH